MRLYPRLLLGASTEISSHPLAISPHSGALPPHMCQTSLLTFPSTLFFFFCVLSLSFNIYLFISIYLAVPHLSCSIWDLGSLLHHAGSRHVGSSSLTREWTWANCVGSTETTREVPAVIFEIFFVCVCVTYECAMCVLSHSVVSDSLRPYGLACQAPLSMGFSRQQYWSGLPCPPPGDLPTPGIEPRSPALQVDSVPIEPPGNPRKDIWMLMFKNSWKKKPQWECIMMKISLFNGVRG